MKLEARSALLEAELELVAEAKLERARAEAANSCDKLGVEVAHQHHAAPFSTAAAAVPERDHNKAIGKRAHADP